MVFNIMVGVTMSKKQVVLTFGDLKNIDFFLAERQSVRLSHQNRNNQILLESLRDKITVIMSQVKVKVAND